jgi:glucose-6-phosphate 1-dehydrogenase
VFGITKPALNQAVHAVFDESQVFRIDHFRGKEPVDNILAFRFADELPVSRQLLVRRTAQRVRAPG